MYQPTRAYQSTTPCSNAALKKRWDEYRYRLHRDKVANVKCTLDNQPPKVYPHLYERMNKYVMEEQRMATIQKDNYLLLNRMADIMHKKGTLDNYNDYEIKSMNGALRQRELLRIAHENQAILARIEAAQPHYNHRKWNQEWQVSRRYMSFISKFPHVGTHHQQKLKTIKLSESPDKVVTVRPPRRTAAQNAYHTGPLRDIYRKK